jgi:hypothetical protein
VNVNDKVSINLPAWQWLIIVGIVGPHANDSGVNDFIDQIYDKVVP